jgi:hypothetical protein
MVQGQNVQFSAERYFNTQPAPPTLDADVAAVREFIRKQKEAGRKVAFVTVRLTFVIHSELA